MDGRESFRLKEGSGSCARPRTDRPYHRDHCQKPIAPTAARRWFHPAMDYPPRTAEVPARDGGIACLAKLEKISWRAWGSVDVRSLVGRLLPRSGRIASSPYFTALLTVLAMKSRLSCAMCSTDLLRAGGLALVDVGAVPEALAVVLRDHRPHPLGAAPAGPAAGARGGRPSRDRNSIAEAFGHAATHAPQPMHSAASIARSWSDLRDRQGVAVRRAAGVHARRTRRPG